MLQCVPQSGEPTARWRRLVLDRTADVDGQIRLAIIVDADRQPEVARKEPVFVSHHQSVVRRANELPRPRTPAISDRYLTELKDLAAIAPSSSGNHA